VARERLSGRCLWALLSLACLSLLGLAAACAGGGSGGRTSSASPTPVPSPAFGLQSEVVAKADHPAALAFTPDGRLLVAEQFTGNIRVVAADGKLLTDPFAHIDVADWLHLDWGLTGLAVDPDFAANHYVYAFYTELRPSDPSRPIGQPKLVRFTDKDGRGTDEKTIIANFPETQLDHQGFKANGRIHFGPDGFLYATVGNYDLSKALAPGGQPPTQDLSSPIGKMLRVSKESGAAPEDNPFVEQTGADPRIFAYGFNQASDFAFHPRTGGIYGSDNTDSCEELNLIKAGGNYGGIPVGAFPYPDCTGGTQVPGIYFLAVPGRKPGEFQSQVNVSAMAFVSGQRYPTLGDSLLLCEASTKLMKRLVLGAAEFSQVTSEDTVAYDCGRALAVSSDGTVYYSNDSQVRRLVPAKAQASSATPPP